MPLQIEPYLTFNGNCEQALEFYAQCLGGKVSFMQRYGGSPMDNAQLPTESFFMAAPHIVTPFAQFGSAIAATFFARQASNSGGSA